MITLPEGVLTQVAALSGESRVVVELCSSMVVSCAGLRGNTVPLFVFVEK